MSINYKPNLSGTLRRKILIGKTTVEEDRKALLKRIKKAINDELKKLDSPSKTLRQKIEKIIQLLVDHFDETIRDGLIDLCAKLIAEEIESKKTEKDEEVKTAGFEKWAGFKKWLREWEKIQKEKPLDTLRPLDDHPVPYYPPWYSDKSVTVYPSGTIIYPSSFISPIEQSLSSDNSDKCNLITSLSNKCENMGPSMCPEQI